MNDLLVDREVSALSLHELALLMNSTVPQGVTLCGVWDEQQVLC